MESAFEAEDRNRIRQKESAKSKDAMSGAERPVRPLGNAATQRLLRAAHLARKGDGVAGSTLDDAVAGKIAAKRGGGQALDAEARSDLGQALGHDFSDVRVHTDGEADSLNRAVEAEAFTTGTDIFFRGGAYNPGSADGRQLLAHELMHVVQQRGAPPSGEMRVSSPDDASERQASSVAEHLASAASASAGGAVAREEAPEEEELQTSPAIAREEMPEEEELQASPAIAREEMPEEEELQASPAVAREEMPEEEELQASPAIAREEMPEEEELQMSAMSRRSARSVAG